MLFELKMMKKAETKKKVITNPIPGVENVFRSQKILLPNSKIKSDHHQPPKFSSTLFCFWHQYLRKMKAFLGCILLLVKIMKNMKEKKPLPSQINV